MDQQTEEPHCMKSRHLSVRIINIKSTYSINIVGYCGEPPNLSTMHSLLRDYRASSNQ